jgi:hypothetical protein
MIGATSVSPSIAVWASVVVSANVGSADAIPAPRRGAVRRRRTSTAPPAAGGTSRRASRRAIQRMRPWCEIVAADGDDKAAEPDA